MITTNRMPHLSAIAYLVLLTSLALVAMPSATLATNPPPTLHPKALALLSTNQGPFVTAIMFGDSTTAARPGAVDKVYAQRVQETLNGLGYNLAVHNAGVGGNSTCDAMKRFDSNVLRHKPRLIVMQFGINDSSVEVWRKTPATEPRVPLAEFESNLRTMIEQARQQGAKVILMITNPLRWANKLKDLYGRAPHRPDDPDGFDAPVLAPYNEAVRKLAKVLGVPLVDIHDAYPTYAAKHNLTVDQLLLDGRHPNDQGHQLVTELLLPVIQEQLR